ncbi:hypothetical protein EZV62_006587 [Acer yangbiense]|uniref:Uncharacterized protein n=1 Tax=Acer yangbiense TaxID=1000413 RepID=A0A5C7I9G7_9ROSI|nr:hypothetical protein EZV62_006587 [Acer yangbiense]
MGSSSVISPQDVLESLMNDGTIDSLRLKIINQLKANVPLSLSLYTLVWFCSYMYAFSLLQEELKNTTIKMVEQSKVLNTPGAEKQTKRELFDALRQELEIPVLEKASKSVWELILNSDGLGKDISETVERVFCLLSGREPLLFPLPNVETQPCKETENETKKGKEKRKEKEHENEKDNSNSALKKRRYTEMNEEGGDNEVAK